MAHVHLGELVRKAGDTRQLIGRSLTELWYVDVLQFGRSTLIVGWLTRLRTHLVWHELVFRCKLL